ncbi:hypothetical protein NC651_026372 [Populus alba x Populus x berolinensis]|nr:hypothetical protein NC651_026372 [Populus alba x Populus x berolinensis]
MSPEVLQKMFEMTSSSRGNDLVPAVASALSADGSSSCAGAKPIETRGKFTVNKNGAINGVSSSLISFFKFEKYSSVKLSCLNFLYARTDRDQMKDPTMQKYLSPENMATTSEHLGINSQEDEDKAQQAMSSLSPEDSDKTM